MSTEPTTEKRSEKGSRVYGPLGPLAPWLEGKGVKGSKRVRGLRGLSLSLSLFHIDEENEPPCGEISLRRKITRRGGELPSCRVASPFTAGASGSAV